MRLPVFAANWKMNNGPTEAQGFMASFLSRWNPRDDRTIVFFPPIISMTTVVRTLGSRTDIGVGAQNISPEEKGAFTGETSAAMAKESGARYVLVGHSERRHVFGETDAETGTKCAAASRHDLTPILCVGELLLEREDGATREVVLRQLRAGLQLLSHDAIASMAIAYEPVWAIGTGKTATPADASSVHVEIREELRVQLGDRANGVPVLYGGSVNTANAASLLAANAVDGLLVGGASLDVHGWAAICNT